MPPFEEERLSPAGDALASIYRAQPGGGMRTFQEALETWSSAEDGMDSFCDTLAQAPPRAFLWETPPIDRDSLDRPFEFALIESRALAGMPEEPDVFAEHFRSRDVRDGITSFWNLGGDALLVAPCPPGPEGMRAGGTYTHLAAFERSAPRERRRALWRAVAAAVKARLSDRPLWISTSGLGVGWLHVRLDSRPKYYHHRPYREEGR